MTTIYIGAEDKREVISILNDLAEQGYLDWYDEESIEPVPQVSSADLEYSTGYVRNYGSIKTVYNPMGFYNRNVYTVDVEE